MAVLFARHIDSVQSLRKLADHTTRYNSIVRVMRNKRAWIVSSRPNKQGPVTQSMIMHMLCIQYDVTDL